VLAVGDWGPTCSGRSATAAWRDFVSPGMLWLVALGGHLLGDPDVA